MTSSRGMALLWVLLLVGLSLGLTAASLAVSRMVVTTSVVTLERADGMFYAEAAAELAVSHIRQNSDLRGRLRPGAALTLSGSLPAVDVSMRYETDLSEFNSIGAHARSALVRVWPSNLSGETTQPFVARATLRHDLTVAEWYVLDHEPGPWGAGKHDLPSFASCSASTPRVTAVSGSQVINTISWELAPLSSAPDEVRVSWLDFRQGGRQTQAVAGTGLQARVSTPLVSSSSARPERVEYVLELVFDERVVDSCVVEVVSGGVYFDVSPTRVCANGDTVRVVWDVNSSSGVELRLRQGGSTTVVSRASVGSLSVPVPDVLRKPRLELMVPSELGGPIRENISVGC